MPWTIIEKPERVIGEIAKHRQVITTVQRRRLDRSTLARKQGGGGNLGQIGLNFVSCMGFLKFLIRNSACLSVTWGYSSFASVNNTLSGTPVA